MQPLDKFRPSVYRIGNPIPGIVYASLKHPVDYENENNVQETTLTLVTDQENEYLNTCNPPFQDLEICNNTVIFYLNFIFKLQFRNRMLTYYIYLFLGAL